MMPVFHGYFGAPATPGGVIIVRKGAGAQPGFGDKGVLAKVPGVVMPGNKIFGMAAGGPGPPAAAGVADCPPVAAGRVFFSFALDSLTDLVAACAENAASEV